MTDEQVTIGDAYYRAFIAGVSAFILTIPMAFLWAVMVPDDVLSIGDFTQLFTGLVFAVLVACVAYLLFGIDRLQQVKWRRANGFLLALAFFSLPVEFVVSAFLNPMLDRYGPSNSTILSLVLALGTPTALLAAAAILKPRLGR